MSLDHAAFLLWLRGCHVCRSLWQRSPKHGCPLAALSQASTASSAVLKVTWWNMYADHFRASPPSYQFMPGQLSPDLWLKKTEIWHRFPLAIMPWTVMWGLYFCCQRCLHLCVGRYGHTWSWTRYVPGDGSAAHTSLLPLPSFFSLSASGRWEMDGMGDGKALCSGCVCLPPCPLI